MRHHSTRFLLCSWAQLWRTNNKRPMSLSPHNQEKISGVKCSYHGKYCCCLNKIPEMLTWLNLWSLVVHLLSVWRNEWRYNSRSLLSSLEPNSWFSVWIQKRYKLNDLTPSLLLVMTKNVPHNHSSMIQKEVEKKFKSQHLFALWMFDLMIVLFFGSLVISDLNS